MVGAELRLHVDILAVAEHLPGASVAAVVGTALKHEFLDDAVKESAIVVPFLDEADKSIAVERCVVIEFHGHVAEVGLDDRFDFLFLGKCAAGEAEC